MGIAEVHLRPMAERLPPAVGKRVRAVVRAFMYGGLCRRTTSLWPLAPCALRTLQSPRTSRCDVYPEHGLFGETPWGLCSGVSASGERCGCRRSLAQFSL